ncbi:MAG: hypothetical protein R3E08_10470 [Thiotrichaceae bacterium]
MKTVITNQHPQFSLYATPHECSYLEMQATTVFIDPLCLVKIQSYTADYRNMDFDAVENICIAHSATIVVHVFQCESP